MTRVVPVEDVEEWLGAWGATRINSFETGEDVQHIDFHAPFPGDQPIRSSIEIVPTGVLKSTLRFGVLDTAGPHPTTDPEWIRRLATQVTEARPPRTQTTFVNYGDTTYDARPHIGHGWLPSERAMGIDRDTGILYRADGDETPTLPFLQFMERAGERIRAEFAGHWEEE